MSFWKRWDSYSWLYVGQLTNELLTYVSVLFAADGL